jgi:hypothetical protein
VANGAISQHVANVIRRAIRANQRELTPMNDHDAMLAIQELMDGVEWSPDTLDAIAQIMVAAGYRLRDLNEVDIEESDA